MYKEKALKMIEHLEKTNQGFCFDGDTGAIWTKETLNEFINPVLKLSNSKGLDFSTGIRVYDW